MIEDQDARKRRGESPRGKFELSKTIATEAENSRRDADRRKSETLRLMRLEREALSKQA